MKKSQIEMKKQARLLVRELERAIEQATSGSHGVLTRCQIMMKQKTFKTLGYDTEKEQFDDLFKSKMSKWQYSRILKAARIANDIGMKPGEMKAGPLLAFADASNQHRPKVLSEAKQLAGGTIPTARNIESAIKNLGLSKKKSAKEPSGASKTTGTKPKKSTVAKQVNKVIGVFSNQEIELILNYIQAKPRLRKALRVIPKLIPGKKKQFVHELKKRIAE